MKSCNKCSVAKPLSDFHLNKSSLDGYTHTCKVCAIAKSRAWYEANREKAAARSKVYRAANKEANVANAQRWAEENRERSREIKAAWKKRNPDAVNRHAREGARRNAEKQALRKKIYREANPHVARAYLKKRRAENPYQKLHDSMGNRFRDVLRSNKGGRSWKSLVGYDSKDLKAHLESKFLPGMTWDNYGDWHIDHIRPVSSFDFSKDVDAVARACWSLENLQPLWASDNLSKNNRWDGIVNAHL